MFQWKLLHTHVSFKFNTRYTEYLNIHFLQLIWVNLFMNICINIVLTPHACLPCGRGSMLPIHGSRCDSAISEQPKMLNFTLQNVKLLKIDSSDDIVWYIPKFRTKLAKRRYMLIFRNNYHFENNQRGTFFCMPLYQLPFAVFELPKMGNFHSVKLKLLSNDTSDDIYCYSNKCRTNFAMHIHHVVYFMFNTKKYISKKL